MTAKYTFTDEQVVAIVLGTAIGSTAKPRHDVSAYLTQLLGEVGGYVAGILVMAVAAALAGVIVHAVFRRSDTSRKSRQPMKG